MAPRVARAWSSDEMLFRLFVQTKVARSSYKWMSHNPTPRLMDGHSSDRGSSSSPPMRPRTFAEILI
jgi:hypothetical protein